MCGVMCVLCMYVACVQCRAVGGCGTLCDVCVCVSGNGVCVCV